jgi:uncharacterized ubiquitin-like protein YukD
MSQEIEIQIKHLTHKTYSLKVPKDLTVGGLKMLLEKESGIKPEEIKLIFKGRIFKNDQENLEELKVENGNVLHMI